MQHGNPHDVVVGALAATLAQEWPTAIVVAGSDGRIVWANTEATALFGYPHEELVTGAVDMLVPESDRAQHARDRERFQTSPSRRVLGAGRELLARRKDGSLIPVEIALTPITVDPWRWVMATIIDLRERGRGDRHRVKGLRTRLGPIDAVDGQQRLLGVPQPADGSETVPVGGGMDGAAPGSEAPYRTLVEATSAVTWSCPPSGLHVVAQPSWMAFTGQTEQEMLGDGWTQAVHPEDAPTVARQWAEEVAAGRPFTSEHRVRRWDGTWRWMSVRAAPIRDVEGRIIEYRGMNFDVSSRKRAEELLRGAHDTFRHLVEHSPFGVYAVDADFRLVQVSAGAQKMFEHVRPLLGRDFAEVLRIIWPEPFASEAIARFRHTLDTGDAYHAPSTVERRRDVNEVESYDWKIERVMLPDGRLGVVCHFYDLSERERHQAATRGREEQLRFAMDAAEAGSWTLLPGTGEFTASDRALQLHGLPPDTPMTHEAAMACVHPDDRARVEAAVQQTLITGEPMRTEHRVAHRNGSIRWVAAHAELRTNAGQPRLIGLVQDITARKQAEQALHDVHDAEHQIAVSLQQALLPATLPRHPGVQLAAQYCAGSQTLQVGGDWYDAFPLDDGRIAFTVGDVVGHGVEAAAAMGQLRTALAAIAPRSSPSALLAELDAFLARTRVTDFATVCYAVYDPATGRLEYTSAGHPPILAVSPSGAVQWLNAAQSPPLLADLEYERGSAAVVLEPETLLVLYSDGLIERPGQHLDTGLQRLQAAARAMLRAPAHDACAHIIRVLEADGPSSDDTVVLTARLTRAQPTTGQHANTSYGAAAGAA